MDICKRNTYRHLMVLLVFPISCFSFAQQGGFILSGQVLDATTREPITIVSIQTGEMSMLANAKGEFQIKVKDGDQLLISHTAYKPVVHIVERSMGSSVEILLVERVVELSEVEVNAFVSEERFKREVLLAVPKYGYEHKVAAKNLQMVREIVPLGYAPDLNRYGLFKDATSVTEVSFFSTNPSMGLLKAIRQLGQRKFRSPALPQRALQEPLDPYRLRKKGHWNDYLERQ